MQLLHMGRDGGPHVHFTKHSLFSCTANNTGEDIRGNKSRFHGTPCNIPTLSTTPLVTTVSSSFLYEKQTEPTLLEYFPKIIF